MLTTDKGDAAMLNDIKSTNAGSASLTTADTTRRVAIEPQPATADKDVTIAPALGRLASAIDNDQDADDLITARSQHVLHLKNLIDNDEYKLDMDALVKNLSRSPLMN